MPAIASVTPLEIPPAVLAGTPILPSTALASASGAPTNRTKIPITIKIIQCFKFSFNQFNTFDPTTSLASLMPSLLTPASR